MTCLYVAFLSFRLEYGSLTLYIRLFKSVMIAGVEGLEPDTCLLYTSPSPRDFIM